MTYHRKISSFEFTARSRVIEERFDDAPEPEDDPRPSFPPLRVVVADGECTDEQTRPLTIAKCRQITVVRTPKKVG